MKLLAAIIAIWWLLYPHVQGMSVSTEALMGSMTSSSTNMPDTMMLLTVRPTEPSSMIIKNMEGGKSAQMKASPEKMQPECPAKPAAMVEAEMECEMMYQKTMGAHNHTEMSMTSEMSMNSTMMDDMTDMKNSTMDMMSNNSTSMMVMMSMHSCSYQCILKKLGVLDSDGMPDKELLDSWLMDNIKNQTASMYIRARLPECFMEMETMNKTMDDKMPEKMDGKMPEKMDGMKDKKMDTKNSDAMAAKGTKAMDMNPMEMEGSKMCDQAMHLVKCLSKDIECSSFRTDMMS